MIDAPQDFQEGKQDSSEPRQIDRRKLIKAATAALLLGLVPSAGTADEQKKEKPEFDITIERLGKIDSALKVDVILRVYSDLIHREEDMVTHKDVLQEMLTDIAHIEKLLPTIRMSATDRSSLLSRCKSLGQELTMRFMASHQVEEMLKERNKAAHKEFMQLQERKQQQHQSTYQKEAALIKTYPYGEYYKERSQNPSGIAEYLPGISDASKMNKVLDIYIR